MAERRWTVMLIPHGRGSSKALSVSPTVLRLGIAVAVVVGAYSVATAFGVLAHGFNTTRAKQLQKENRVLSEALFRLDARMDALSDTLAAISRADEQVRLMAGLDPLDPDVRRAGVGGPAGDWPEREGLARDGGRAGREALRAHMDLDALVRRANLLSVSFRTASETLASNVRRLSATPSIMPTAGYLSSNFSSLRFHPVLHVGRPHEGIDITAPYGSPVIAPGSGRVVKVGWENGYGTMVVLDHGYGIETRYAHLSRAAVSVGQAVRRGDRIGFVGTSGLSLGPHLHYEVWVNGQAANPLRFVLPDAVSD